MRSMLWKVVHSVRRQMMTGKTFTALYVVAKIKLKITLKRNKFNFPYFEISIYITLYQSLFLIN